MNRIEIDRNFRGNVYITQGETVLCEYCNGFADLANEIPNSFETRFACASMGKTFVAVGILQLIERGKLSFSDTLGDILDIMAMVYGLSIILMEKTMYICKGVMMV